jgi:hypothetical protein
MGLAGESVVGSGEVADDWLPGTVAYDTVDENYSVVMMTVASG